jgi:enterobactin synthetase component D
MTSLSPRLPACCPTLTAAWPFATALPGLSLVKAAFDAELLELADFARCGIVPPPNILGAIAKRKAEYLAGRLCAREALAQLRGRGETPAVDEDGAPHWPAGSSGSITHSKGWAAAIVGDSQHWRGLGLDAEVPLSDLRAQRLCGEILTEAEQQRLAPGDCSLAVTLTFSLKECLYKALYPLVRKNFYFQDAELLHWDERGHARLRLLKTLSPEWRLGVELDGQFSLVDGRLLSLVAVGA